MQRTHWFGFADPANRLIWLLVECWFGAFLKVSCVFLAAAELVYAQTLPLLYKTEQIMFSAHILAYLLAPFVNKIYVFP